MWMIFFWPMIMCDNVIANLSVQIVLQFVIMSLQICDCNLLILFVIEIHDIADMTYEWSVSHIWMKQHVTHMNEASCHTYEWSSMSHTWMKQHVTHMNEAAGHTHEWISVSHIWMKQHVTHMNEAACHTYKKVVWWSRWMCLTRFLGVALCAHTYVCVYVCMCVCVYVCTCICVFVCMMCVCMLI